MLQKEHPLLQPAASGGLGSTLCELLLLTCSWVCVNQQVQEPISSRSSFILLPFVFFFLDLFLTVLHHDLQVCATSATQLLSNLCCSSLCLLKEQNFMPVDAPLVLMRFLPRLVASTQRDKGSTPVIFYKIHPIVWVKKCRSAPDLPPCCLCCCYGMCPYATEPFFL